MENRQEKFAKAFCAAIKEIASKPENMDNFESYLSHHFAEWLEKYANSYEGLTYELESFAKMEI